MSGFIPALVSSMALFLAPLAINKTTYTLVYAAIVRRDGSSSTSFDVNSSVVSGGWGEDDFLELVEGEYVVKITKGTVSSLVPSYDTDSADFSVKSWSVKSTPGTYSVTVGWSFSGNVTFTRSATYSVVVEQDLDDPPILILWDFGYGTASNPLTKEDF